MEARESGQPPVTRQVVCVQDVGPRLSENPAKRVASSQDAEKPERRARLRSHPVNDEAAIERRGYGAIAGKDEVDGVASIEKEGCPPSCVNTVGIAHKHEGERPLTQIRCHE